MKRAILSFLAVCYISFALIMATQGSIATLNRASIINSQNNQPMRLRHGWSPLQARKSNNAQKEIPVPLTQNEVTKDFKPNCLIFWSAEWCISCKQMYKTVTQLQKEGYVVYILDYDENRELGSEWGIRTLPTSIIWEDGEEVARHIGVIGVDNIKKTLKKNLIPTYILW